MEIDSSTVLGMAVKLIVWGLGSLGRPFDSLCSLRVNSFHVREVQRCKLAMIYLCGVVIGLCGVGFVSERAEVYFSVIELNSGFPLSLNSAPFKAFVF